MPDRATMNALLLAKIETTEGTDAAPVAATDAIQLIEPFEPTGEMSLQRMRDKALVGVGFQGIPPTKGTGFITNWPSKFYLRGSRNTTAFSAANLPDTDPYMMAAGCAGTLVVTGGSESITYKPAASGLKSITEYYYVDGKLRKHLAAKADITMSVEAGYPIELAVKRIGLYQADTDVAIPASPAFGTADPPIADASIAFTIGGFATAIARKFTMSFGNRIEQRPSLNATTGGLSFPKIRDRAIGWTLLLEEELVGTIDMEGWRRSNTGLAVSFLQGAIQYNKAQFNAPNARVEKIKVQDSGGTQMLLLEGHLYDSAPGLNDAFSLKQF